MDECLLWAKTTSSKDQNIKYLYQ